MSIIEAKRELFGLLKSRFRKTLIGSGVEMENGKELIVLYFSRKLPQKSMQAIQEKYGDYSVKSEVTGKAIAL